MNYSYTTSIEELSLFSAFESTRKEDGSGETQTGLRGHMNMYPGTLMFYFRNIALEF